MIEFTEDKRFIGFWFVYPPHEGLRDRRADWFCGSWLNPDGTLQFSYRFHYYDDPKDHSDGERSWYGFKGKTPADENEIKKHIDITTQLAQLNVLRNQSKMEFVDCRLCSGPEAVELLRQCEWFHEASGKMYEEKL